MGWLLIDRKQGQGAQGNFALHLLPPIPPSTENREGGGAVGGGPPGHGGGREAGQNGEEDEGVRFPYLSRAGMKRGGLATKAGGGGRRWPWRRRCKARGGASGGGRVCGGGERDGRPIYCDRTSQIKLA